MTTGNLQQSVSTIFGISFSRLEKKNPVAAQLVRLSAFLYREKIPEAILKQCVKDFIGTFELIFDPDALDEAVLDACQSGFLRFNSHNKTFLIDGLVQEFVKQNMSDSEQQQYAELAVKAVNNFFPEVKSSKDLSRYKHFMPCAQACMDLIEQRNLIFEEAAHFLQKVGRYLYEIEDYIKAESLLKQALSIRDKLPIKGKLESAEDIIYLANTYHAQGEYQQAKSLCQEALGLCENMLGEANSELADSLTNLASLYQAQGEYGQAKLLFEQALQTVEKVKGIWHPEVAKSLSQLAGLYYDQSEYEQAKPLYERALEILEKAHGEDHPNLVNTLTRLGELFEAQKKYDQAKVFYDRALKILGND